MFHVYLRKNVYSAIVGSILYMSIRSNLSIMLFTSSAYLLILSLVVLSNVENEVLKSTTIIVEMFICLQSVKVYIIYFFPLIFGGCVFIITPSS